MVQTQDSFFHLTEGDLQQRVSDWLRSHSEGVTEQGCARLLVPWLGLPCPAHVALVPTVTEAIAQTPVGSGLKLGPDTLHSTI